MSRPIIPVNFDNDEELLAYVNKKGNRAEFIRYCIRKEMAEEKKALHTEEGLEAKIEKVVMRCLEQYKPTMVATGEAVAEEDTALMEAASFFDED